MDNGQNPFGGQVEQGNGAGGADPQMGFAFNAGPGTADADRGMENVNGRDSVQSAGGAENAGRTADMSDGKEQIIPGVTPESGAEFPDGGVQPGAEQNLHYRGEDFPGGGVQPGAEQNLHYQGEGFPGGGVQPGAEQNLHYQGEGFPGGGVQPGAEQNLHYRGEDFPNGGGQPYAGQNGAYQQQAEPKGSIQYAQEQNSYYQENGGPCEGNAGQAAGGQGVFYQSANNSNAYYQAGDGQNPYYQNNYDSNAYNQNYYAQNQYGRNQYGQNMNYPQYQQYPVPKEQEEPVSMLDWVGTILLAAVPCAGLIVYIVWAFSKDTKKSKANYCKASLLIMLIGGALYILLILFIFFAEFSYWLY